MAKTTLIKDIETEYKTNFGVNPRMKLTTYFRRNGLSSLANILERIDFKQPSPAKSGKG